MIVKDINTNKVIELKEGECLMFKHKFGTSHVEEFIGDGLHFFRLRMEGLRKVDFSKEAWLEFKENVKNVAIKYAECKFEVPEKRPDFKFINDKLYVDLRFLRCFMELDCIQFTNIRFRDYVYSVLGDKTDIIQEEEKEFPFTFDCWVSELTAIEFMKKEQPYNESKFLKIVKAFKDKVKTKYNKNSNV